MKLICSQLVLLCSVVLFTSCQTTQAYLDKYKEIDAHVSKKIKHYKIRADLDVFEKKEIIKEIKKLGKTFKAKKNWNESERIYFLQLLEEAEAEVRAKRK